MNKGEEVIREIIKKSDEYFSTSKKRDGFEVSVGGFVLLIEGQGKYFPMDDEEMFSDLARIPNFKEMEGPSIANVMAVTFLFDSDFDLQSVVTKTMNAVAAIANKHMETKDG